MNLFNHALLKEYRLQRGLTQLEAAKKLGGGKNYICRLRKRQDPTAYRQAAKNINVAGYTDRATYASK